MVRYWRRTRERGWRKSLLVNGAGGVTTAIVTLLVIQAKFAEGAWMVTVAVPALVLAFYGTQRHYRRVGLRLRAGVNAVAAAPKPTNDVVLYVESVDTALREALWYANRISGDGFRAISAPGRRTDPGLRARFRQLTDIRPDLQPLSTAEGRVESVIEYLWALPRGESQFVTVVVSEQFRRRSLLEAVARRPEFSLKLRLLTEPGVVVTNLAVLGANAGRSLPSHASCRVLVSGAHAATMRAVNYATTLGFDDTKAVFFAFDADEAATLRRDWHERRIPCELEIDEAPFRDLGDPLLRYLRAITADPDAAVVVVMPELIFRGWRRLLHNQRAVYVKRLLLFEPRVILATVPYPLN
jgi:hypothetical protein